MEKYKPIHLESWVKENADKFVPPVCNKVMYGNSEDEELQVMFVGGPNSRKDYHIEEGEELFIMLKGHMYLPVMEQGNPKLVVINQGDVFLLPKLIPHSPQRFADTLGLVIESKRHAHHLDCLRYYVDGSDNSEILWEEWFHCTNLEDLKAVIDKFKASEQYASGKPVAGFISPPPRPINVCSTVPDPFSLHNFLEANAKKFVEGGVTICESDQTSFRAFSNGAYRVDVSSHGILVWQYRGDAKVVEQEEMKEGDGGQVVELQEGSFFLLRPHPQSLTKDVTLRVPEGSISLTIRQSI